MLCTEHQTRVCNRRSDSYDIIPTLIQHVPSFPPNLPLSLSAYPVSQLMLGIQDKEICWLDRLPL